MPIPATKTDRVGHTDDTGTPSGHCKVIAEPARLSHSTIGPIANSSSPISTPIMAEDKLFRDIGVKTETVRFF